MYSCLTKRVGRTGTSGRKTIRPIKTMIRHCMTYSSRTAEPSFAKGAGSEPLWVGLSWQKSEYLVEILQRNTKDEADIA